MIPAEDELGYCTWHLCYHHYNYYYYYCHHPFKIENLIWTWKPFLTSCFLFVCFRTYLVQRVRESLHNAGLEILEHMRVLVQIQRSKLWYYIMLIDRKIKNKTKSIINGMFVLQNLVLLFFFLRLQRNVSVSFDTQMKIKFIVID